jgi:hypothetical protein
MAQIINLAATTELEAVNAMLATIGESPIADVDTATQADATIAINTLRDVVREVQSMGWKFNTEFGYQVAPEAATYDWVDLDGVTTTLNIFKRPAGLIDFEVTKIPSQQGSSYVDTTLKKSRKYQETGAYVEVFYDRRNNRDGFKASDFPYLYINPTWLMDFSDMPETARRFGVIVAARRFQASVVGSEVLHSFTERDERVAYRNLKRAEGQKDNLNMFNNSGTAAILGWPRRFGVTGVFEDRNTAGPA